MAAIVLAMAMLRTPADDPVELSLWQSVANGGDAMALGTTLALQHALRVIPIEALRMILVGLKLLTLAFFLRRASFVFGADVAGEAVWMILASPSMLITAASITSRSVAEPLVWSAFGLLLQVRNGLALSVLTVATFVYAPVGFLLLGYLALLASKRPAITLQYCKVILPVCMAGLIAQGLLRYLHYGYFTLPTVQSSLVASPHQFLSALWHLGNRHMNVGVVFLIGGIVGRFGPLKFASPALLYMALCALLGVHNHAMLVVLPNVALLAGSVCFHWYESIV